MLSPFESAALAAASWRLQLDQLKLSGLFKIALNNNLLYKADISRVKLQNILAEHLLDPFERIGFGLDNLPVLSLDDISLAGISGEINCWIALDCSLSQVKFLTPIIHTRNAGK
jgi:hypothetical protein